MDRAECPLLGPAPSAESRPIADISAESLIRPFMALSGRSEGLLLARVFVRHPLDERALEKFASAVYR